MNFYIIGNVDMQEVQATSKIFTDAALQIMQAGHEASSIISAQNLNWMADRELEVKERVRMLCNAQAVFVIPGWAKDPLAKIEMALATQLNKKIHRANDVWIDGYVTLWLSKTVGHGKINF
jgi:hypothetical protein